MRHRVLKEYDPAPGVSISSLAYEYPSGYDVPEHAHYSDQLIYATCGVMEVSTGQRLWLTPPHLAVWIPARTRHRIRMLRAVSMRTLYFRRGLAIRAAGGCAVLHISPLLRELILEAIRIRDLRVKNHCHRALRDLIVSQLQKASPVPMLLTLPTESRALVVAQAYIAKQVEAPLLHALCKDAGVSVRTIERIFRKDVGMSFEVWRRQARLMKAMELLVKGNSLKQIASRVGYRQTSALVELFRQTLGTTPKAWISHLTKAE